jgi:DNA-binding LacI/PurR family transcriptional regulator
VKIHDLARHLNVSIGTVSRALNGRSDVSAETRQRVLDAAKRLGYAPNQSGRSLRRGATGMIGFMIIANRARSSKGEAFFMTVFDGLQSILSKHDRDLVIYYCGSGQDPNAYVKRIVERRLVDGMIISQTARIDGRIDYLIRQELPFIAFGRSESGGDHSWIDLDFEGVAEQSIDLLTRQGHRRIAIATTSDDVNFGHIYLEACRSALAHRGIALDDDLVFRESMSEAGGHHLGEGLIACGSRPTAVVLVASLMATGLYNKLHAAGIMPGRDIAVIGFDQSPTIGLSLSPPLTQFRLSLVDLGIWVGEHMLAMIEAKQDGKTIPVARKIWPMDIVLGGSTPGPCSAVAPATSPHAAAAR